MSAVVLAAHTWANNAALIADVARLGYLGGLDPDSDVELIAWHLLTNRDEIARLRRLLVKAQDQCELVSARLAEIEDVADTAHSMSEELRGWCEAGVEMHTVDGILPAEDPL